MKRAAAWARLLLPIERRVPRCVRTARAEKDLVELWLYIGTDNPSAADKLLDRIYSVFGLLATNPAMGPARPDLAPGFRYFVVRNYLILYRQLADGVEIVRVVHGARDLSNLI